MDNVEYKAGIEHTAKDGNLVFAVDVGTRIVAGVVGAWECETFRVVAAEVYEHRNRVMYNGQIHDIQEVARAVITIKCRLEKKLGSTLDKVYIAAAGRALKTIRVESTADLAPDQDIDDKLLRALETEALKSAREKVSQEASTSIEKFDFVGCSILKMYLDGYPIGNLLGHRGDNIKIEMLAAYLPRAVNFSLFSVMKKAGLVVAGMTLEPIAALNATVAKENRKLNIALVDIGAGTTDIAITKNGIISGCEMILNAGDNITDLISEHYLTDFNASEKIKYSIYEECEEISFKDIFGRSVKISREEAYKVILPGIKELALDVAETILTGNGTKPSAVIVVGGGCKLPEFNRRLAEALDMDFDRVTTGSRDTIANLVCDLDILKGPEAVTPFGIALCGADDHNFFSEYMTIYLNGEPVRLQEAKSYSVTDVLDYAFIKPSDYMPNPGKPLNFLLNGEPMTVMGGAGKPIGILVNGKEAGLDAPLSFGDEVTVERAEDGRNARVHISDLAPNAETGTVTFGGDIYYIAPKAYINGAECPMSAEVREGDSVGLITRTTVRMFMDECIKSEAGTVYCVNGSIVDESCILKPGDEISVLEETLGPSGEMINEPSDGLTIEPSNELSIEPPDETQDEPSHELTIRPPDELMIKPSDELLIKPPDETAPEPPDGLVIKPPDATPDELTIKPSAVTPDEPPADISYETVSDISYEAGSDLSDETVAGISDETVTGEAELYESIININGADVRISSDSGEKFLVDALNYVDLDNVDKKGRLILTINGVPAGLSERIRPGDAITVKWAAE